MAKIHIKTKINGDHTEYLCEPYDTMLDVLRKQLNLTGSKEVCSSGDCGACSITLDDRLVCSCLMLAAEAEGKEIKTIEGMATNGKLHPIQESFREKHGLQCGFCTPGMIMSSWQLLERNPNPSEDEIRHALEGNFCRCTGYHNIVNAVQDAASKG